LVVRPIKICLHIAKKLAKLYTRGIYFLDGSPDNILLNDEHDVRLNDFKFALQGYLSDFEGWKVGTPGFTPVAKVWSATQAPLKQKLIYKDVFALGNILLAILNRDWYSNISKNTHPSLAKKHENIKRFLSKLG